MRKNKMKEEDNKKIIEPWQQCTEKAKTERLRILYQVKMSFLPECKRQTVSDLKKFSEKYIFKKYFGRYTPVYRKIKT